MTIERAIRAGYTEIYHSFADGEDFINAENSITLVKCLVRYELHDGYKLWEASAAYAKGVKKTPYYVIATTKINAIKKFKSLLPWIQYAVMREMGDEELEAILSNPAKHIVF